MNGFLSKSCHMMERSTGNEIRMRDTKITTFRGPAAKLVKVQSARELHFPFFKYFFIFENFN